MSKLDKNQRRWYAGVESSRTGVTLHSNPEMMLVCYQSVSGN
jgi:hypothetical protein